MASRLPDFPLDLVAPTLFAEKVVSQLDQWGMLRARPSRDDLLTAVRIVAVGADPMTKDMLKKEPAQNAGVDAAGIQDAQTGSAIRSRQPCAGKRLREYSREELAALQAATSGNITRIADKVGVSTALVRRYLQKAGLHPRGRRTR